MKTTLNPFENAKRTAHGTGGISPAIIEEMQAEISILGSQNTQQAQDITDIKGSLNSINDNLDHAVYDLNLSNSKMIVRETTSFPYTYTPTTDGMLICQRLLGTLSSIADAIKINGVSVAVASSGYSYSMTIPVRHGDIIVFDYLNTASRVMFCPRATS